MNDLAIGRVLRRLRQRRNWRQQDVAARAGISDSAYSDMERGHLEHVPLGKIRKVAAVLEVDIYVEPRWRGGALDRELSARHADMSEAVTALLIGAGWNVRPEVSFSHAGERGIVDLVGWRAERRVLLLVELKTELTSVNDLLGVTNRRRRLGAVIAACCGWTPGMIAQWIVLAEGRTNRRRVAERRTVLRSAFPADGRAIRAWLRAPDSPMDALWFLPDSAGSGLRRRRAPRLRVRHDAGNVSSVDLPANFRGLENLADDEQSDSP